MKHLIINANEIQLNARRSWGHLNPVTKIVQSKKVYSRKNKSWMKEI